MWKKAVLAILFTAVVSITSIEIYKQARDPYSAYLEYTKTLHQNKYKNHPNVVSDISASDFHVLAKNDVDAKVLITQSISYAELHELRFDGYINKYEPECVRSNNDVYMLISLKEGGYAVFVGEDPFPEAFIPMEKEEFISKIEIGKTTISEVYQIDPYYTHSSSGVVTSFHRINGGKLLECMYTYDKEREANVVGAIYEVTDGLYEKLLPIDKELIDNYRSGVTRERFESNNPKLIEKTRKSH